MAEALDIIVSVVDKATAQLKNITGQVKKSMEDTKASAADASVFIAKGFAAGGAALATLGGFAIKAAADAEQTKIAFNTMLGSAEAADTFIKGLISFAKTTPFELKDLEKSSKQLLAYGFNAKETLKSIDVLGNIAAGVGTDKMPQLILAFGQVHAATKLTGAELRQFSEAGVPLLEILAKQFKTNAGAIQEMVKDGQIGFKDVEKALTSLTSEGGKFNNLMENQSKSLNGMISNLKDAWDIFLRGEGARLIEWAKSFIAILIDLVSNKLPAFIKVIEQVTGWLMRHKEVLILVAGAIVGALTPAVLALVAAFWAGIPAFIAAAVALAPFILGGIAIAGIIAGIYLLVKNWDWVKGKAIEIWTAVAEFLGGIWDAITNKVSAVWNGIKNFFGAIWQGIVDVFNFFIALVVGIVVTVFDAMGIDIVTIFSDVKNALAAWWEAAKQLFATMLEIIKALWSSAWTVVKTVFTAIWNGIKAYFSDSLMWTVNKIIEFTKPVTDAFGKMWNAVGQIINDVWEGIKDGVKSNINWVIKKINDFIDAVNTVAQKGAGVIGVSAPQISQIPFLANGGIIQNGGAAIVGERGAELVDLPRGARVSPLPTGAGITIIINNPMILSDDDIVEKIGDPILRVLTQHLAIP